MEPSLTRAPIDSVLVFRRGARITRRLTLDAPAERLSIGPLPLDMADGSVRIRARGARVRHAAVALTAPAPADGRPGRNEPLEEARAQEGIVEARIQAVNRARAALEPMPSPPRRRLEEREPGPSPTKARQVAARLRRELREGCHERLAMLEEALRVAREQRLALEEEELRASSAREPRPHELRKALDVELAEATAGAVLTIEYDVAAARWFPVYTLRFDDGFEQARLEIRALLAQRSGEDWEGAALTCATSLPDRRAHLPELRSIRLGRAQPLPPRGFREAPTDTEALFADFDRGYPEAARAPRQRPAPVSRKGTPGMILESAADEGGAPPPPIMAPPAAPQGGLLAVSAMAREARRGRRAERLASERRAGR